MPVWPRSRHLACGVTAVMLLAGCATGSTPAPSTPAPTTAGAPARLVPVTVTVPAGLDQQPFDTARQALVPPGWTLSVWARVPKARLAAWTPDGRRRSGAPARRS